MAEDYDEEVFGGSKLLGFVDWFEIRDRGRLLVALAGLENLEASGEDEWTWYVSSNRGRKVVAELAIEGGSLALETYTERDAELCRSRVEKAADDAIEFMIGEECRGML